TSRSVSSSKLPSARVKPLLGWPSPFSGMKVTMAPASGSPSSVTRPLTFTSGPLEQPMPDAARTAARLATIGERQYFDGPLFLEVRRQNLAIIAAAQQLVSLVVDVLTHEMD